MTALVYGIVRSADAGLADPITIGALIAGVALLAGFVLREWKARQPIMPLRLFASRDRVGAYAGRILFLGAMMGFWFFITQFLQTVKGYRPLEAGIAFLPMTVVNFAVAICTLRLTRRFGNGPLLAAGITLTMIGMFWLSRLTADTSYLTGVALPMILIGAGQGASLGPLTAAANVAGLDPSHLLAHRVGAALTVGSGLLAAALVLVLALIVRPRRPAPLVSSAARV